MRTLAVLLAAAVLSCTSIQQQYASDLRNAELKRACESRPTRVIHPPVTPREGQLFVMYAIERHEWRDGRCVAEAAVVFAEVR